MATTTYEPGKIYTRKAFPNLSKPTPTQVSYGINIYSEACAEFVRDTLHARKVYIVASKSLSKSTEYLSRLENALGSSHVASSLGISAHTPLDELLSIIKDVERLEADCIVTLGGSSLTDGVELVSFGIANHVTTIDDFYKLRMRLETDPKTGSLSAVTPPELNPPTIPLIFIPTTLSASEFSRYAGGTDPRTHEKIITGHDGLYARLVVLDPVVADSTPEWVWLSTGVRAIDHCVESICSKNPTEESTAACQEGLRLLVPNLIRCKDDLKDHQAKLRCLLGANLSLTPLVLGVMAGGSHGLGHQLGPIGVGHGQTSCIMNPAVMKFNKKANAAHQETTRATLWEMPLVRQELAKGGLTEQGSDLGDATDVIIRRLGMPRTLKEVGVPREKLQIIAENSTRDPLCIANPVPLTTAADIMPILESVYED